MKGAVWRVLTNGSMYMRIAENLVLRDRPVQGNGPNGGREYCRCKERLLEEKIAIAPNLNRGLGT